MRRSRRRSRATDAAPRGDERDRQRLPAACGNGVVEPGETCDGDSCPTTCPLPPPDLIGRHGCLLNAVVGDPGSLRSALRVARDRRVQPVTTRMAAAPTAARRERSRLLARVRRRRSSNRRWAKNATPDIAGASPVRARPRATTRTHARTTTWSAPGRVPRAAYTCPSRIGVRRRLLPCRARRSIWIPDCPALCGNGIVDRPAEICDYGAGAGCPGLDVSVRPTPAPPTP